MTNALEAAIVPAQSISHLAAKGQEGVAVANQLRGLPCTTPEQELFFSDCLLKIRDVLKGLEKERLSLTKPLHDVKSRLDLLFRNTSTGWADAEDVTRRKLQAAAQVRLDAEREAKRLAAEAAAAQNHTAVVEALAAVPAPVAGLTGSSSGEAWELDHANVDMSQVPRDWLCLDHSKVKIYLRQHAKSETIAAVPGLPFKRVATVRAK